MDILKDINMQVQLVKYLDYKGCVRALEKSAIAYRKEWGNNIQVTDYPPPFQFTVKIDFVTLAEIAGDFGAVLLEEPFLGKLVVERVVVKSVRVLLDWPSFSPDLLHCILLLDSLPNLPQLSYFPLHPPRRSSTGLFLLQGILTTLTSPIKLMESTVYKCLYCEEGEGRRREWGVGGGACRGCGGQEKEVQRARINTDYVLGTFLPQEALTPSPNESYRKQAATLHFHEELGKGLEVGMRYSVVVSRWKEGYLAWGVQPLFPESLSRHLRGFSPPTLPLPLTSFISQIRNDCGESPWDIVTALAAQMFSDDYPTSSYLHLKTALLLSLASVGVKTPVGILALGECGAVLRRGANLSPWGWSPSLSALQSGDPGRQTGPLLLSSYGLCFIGQLPKSNVVAPILQGVESELVTSYLCSVGSEKSKGPPKTRTLPLRAAVWTYWPCDKHSPQDMHHLRTLIDIFGIPFLAEIGMDDEEYTSHVLRNETSTQKRKTPLLDQDVKKYLEIVSWQTVEMSSMASSLIKNYFVASRRERPEALPVRAIKILSSLCEAHAKLSLRSTVTYEDVVAVLYLYEESLASLFGPTVFTQPPKRTLQSTHIPDIVSAMNTILGKFSFWLDTYIKSLISGSSVASLADQSFL